MTVSHFYVLVFAGDCSHRLKALNCVLSWLANYSDCLETVLVLGCQAGTESAAVKSAAKLASSVVFAPACCNPERGYFNRSKAFNIGASFVATASRDDRDKFIWFADSDIIVCDNGKNTGGFTDCLHRASRSTVFRPFTTLYDLCVQHTSMQQSGRMVTPAQCVVCADCESRHGLSASSGIVGMPLEIWREVDGWDETFEGWGYEDAAMDVRLSLQLAQKLNSCRWTLFSDSIALHMYHPRGGDGAEQLDSAARLATARNKEQFERKYLVLYDSVRQWISSNCALAQPP